jgi:uncharacterized protein HemX
MLVVAKLLGVSLGVLGFVNIDQQMLARASKCQANQHQRHGLALSSISQHMLANASKCQANQHQRHGLAFPSIS